MIEIDKPRVECVESHDEGTYGRFVIEPLERGYGTTLGNALRRVLLSSLTGAAVSSVRIQGVLHQFSTIPGVREDTMDLILNLKGLSLKLFSDEAKNIRIVAHGPGEVLAGEVITNPEVEVLNPDHHIAYLDEGAELVIDLTIERGRGYVPADRNKRTDMPIGVIAVDSIFSPIRRVNYQIEATRVGQVTDYDRLILEVWTNGAIHPEEAISTASRILVEHFRHFMGLSDDVALIESAREVKEDTSNRILEMPIEELDLSVRSYNCLKRAGINTVHELTDKTDEDMMKVRNLGKKSLEEVKIKLINLGLSLKPSEE